MNYQIAEIEKMISDKGYLTIVSSKIEPSYYKLSDDAIIEAHLNLIYVKLDPASPNGITINSANTSNCYISTDKLNPSSFMPWTQNDLQKGIIADDMEMETLRENFSVYQLSNGMKISIKSVVTQVDKTKYVMPTGESIYVVNQAPIFKIKANIKSLSTPDKYA